MKKKLTIFLSVIIIILITIGFKTVGTDNNSLAQFFKSLIPENAKTFLKKTLFAVPVLLEQNIANIKRIENLESEISVLKSRLQYIENPIYLEKLPIRELVSNKKKKYQLDLYKIPLPDHDGWGLKPVAYLEQYENKIFFISGKADFFYFNLENQENSKLKYFKVSSNINQIIDDEKFYNSFILSIKDVFILNEKIYFTFGNQKNNCINISVFEANINFEKLVFKKYFTKEECHNFFKEYDMNYQHIGGRLVKYKNEKILLSVGDFGDESLPQDKNSIFGKIISIDNKNNYEIISLGTRNPQGLKYDEKNDVIINTEHGPVGGDEININSNTSTLKNFGWPIASYGVSASGKKYKNHKEYSYEEPIKYFDPSIGISEIIKIDNNFDPEFLNDYFVSSLGFKSEILEGDNSIHHLRFNKNYSKIIYEDKIILNERIRDGIYLSDYKLIILSLETIPAIGFLKKID